MNRTPTRIAAGLLAAAALAAVGLAGATAASADSATGSSRSSGYSARPLAPADLTASGSELIALENSTDSTPTAAENEGFADEWNIAAGCMAARGFYVNPTITNGKGTPAALQALNAPYNVDPSKSGCFALAQHLVGSRDPH